MGGQYLKSVKKTDCFSPSHVSVILFLTKCSEFNYLTSEAMGLYSPINGSKSIYLYEFGRAIHGFYDDY